MIPLIAIDCGYGFCKGVSDKKELRFPSVVSLATERGFVQPPSSTEVESKQGLVITYKEKDWFVGQLALSQGHHPRATLDRSRTKSTEMDILFLAMAACLAPSPISEIEVVTGLPVTDFADHAWLVSHFTGTHRFKLNGTPYELTIRKVSVVPQPYGGYFNRLVTSSGFVEESLSQGTIGIIDIGYLTADLVLVRDGEYIEKLCTSLPGGISEVYRNCGKILSAHYPSRFEERDVENVLREDVIYHMGRQIPLDRSLIYPEFVSYADRIVSTVETLWSREQVGLMIGCGGGIFPLRSVMQERWPAIVIQADAQMSNVRGYYKFGMITKD